MFTNFFKRRWICQKAVEYIRNLPKMFRVYYTIDVNGRHIDFDIRDEDGNMRDDVDWYCKKVVGIGIQFHEDGFRETYYLKDVLDQFTLQYVKKCFERVIGMCPKSECRVSSKALYAMQAGIRKEIERTTFVTGAYDGKDIVYNLSAIDQAHRDRIVDVLRRLGSDCVDVSVVIHISGATDEQIGATMDELAMVESVEAEC